MKYILTVLFIAFTMLMMKAQNVPDKETVLKDARSVKALADINFTAVKKYTWSQINLQYKEFANGDNLYEPKFRTVQSEQAKKMNLSYDDLGYVYVIATTPKDAEGVYYDCSIRVLYYRSSQNGAWQFKESAMEENGFYRRGTETVNNKAVMEAIEIMSKYKGAESANETYQLMNNSDMDFVKIEEIQKDPKRDDYITSSQKYLYFLVKGTVALFAAHSDYAELLYYYENALVELTIRSDKDADGKWKLISVEMAPRILNQGVGPEYSKGFKEIPVNEEEKFAVKRYKTLKLHGFNEVYKKQSFFERSQFTPTDLQLLEEKLKILGELLFNDPEKGKARLKSFIKPEMPNFEEVYNSWVSFFQNAKKYECEINFSKPSVSGVSGSELDKAKTDYNVSPAISVKRKGTYNNKALQRKYKELGMSKETLSKDFGALNGESPEDYKIEYYKGNWYITGGLKFREGTNWD